ncbi:hypothetical protein BGX20_004537 [Mortierella sp. AD010]|nr:hypothetical protein BGX20_004537 [Mortierella sp. AD010]
MKRFTSDFDIYKTEFYEARAAKRAARDAQSKPEKDAMVVNPFATIDKPDAALNHQYRSRFGPKVRFEPSEELPAPNILMRYELKSWKAPPEKPTPPTPAKKKPTSIKAEVGEDSRFERKQILDALSFEHPTVILNVDRLSKNVRAAVKNEFDRLPSSNYTASNSDLIAKAIIDCIRSVVKVGSETKLYCQQLIGLTWRTCSTLGLHLANLVLLCLRLSSKEINDDNDDANTAEDGREDDSNTPLFHFFLMFLYSGNLPDDNKVGSSVNGFIDRLQEMDHLEKFEQNKVEMLKNTKEYTPNFRWPPNYTSTEPRRCPKRYHTAENMIEKGNLPGAQAVDLTSNDPTIHLFVRANAAAGRPWRPSLPPTDEHRYMTFTEIELAAFLHKREEPHPILKTLTCRKDERRLTQADVTQDWFPLKESETRGIPQAGGLTFTHPWIGRGGASTAGVKDALGPSQQASGNGSLKRQAEKGGETDQDKVNKRSKAVVAKQGTVSKKGEMNAVQVDS